jgi:hypothetical protein
MDLLLLPSDLIVMFVCLTVAGAIIMVLMRRKTY